MSPSVHSRCCERRGRQHADHAVVMDQWRDQVAGELEDARVALDAVPAVVARVRPGGHPTGPQDLGDPALVDREHGQGVGDLIGQAGPGRDHEPILLDDPDRDVVDAQGPPCLVHDRPEQLAPVVALRQPFRDVEDGIEPLGELRLERLVLAVAVCAASPRGEPSSRRR